MSKSATRATQAVNEEYLCKLPFNEDNKNLEDVERGLIEETPDLVIRDEEGNITWDAKAFYDFLKKSADAPDTVNPSLWRHQRLECMSGFFEVTDGIWQVRGYDISNLTLIRSDNGYILVDPLLSPHSARAAMKLAFKHLPKKPVTGVVITHSHADHYGGLVGALPPELLNEGKIPVVVPKDFVRNSIIENVFVGRAMTRRGPYQFGQKLPKSVTGTVGAGLGISLAKARSGFVMPTHEVTATGEKLNIDGVEFIFEMTPDAEAPAEFCFYLPQYKTLCMAELLNSHLHNLLPIRGAQVRSARQ